MWFWKDKVQNSKNWRLENFTKLSQNAAVCWLSNVGGMGSFRLLFDHGGNDNISELSTDRNFDSFDDDDDGNDHGDKENDNVDDDDDDARSENREQRERLVTWLAGLMPFPADVSRLMLKYWGDDDICDDHYDHDYDCDGHLIKLWWWLWKWFLSWHSPKNAKNSHSTQDWFNIIWMKRNTYDMTECPLDNVIWEICWIPKPGQSIKGDVVIGTWRLEVRSFPIFGPGLPIFGGRLTSDGNGIKPSH